MKTPEPNRRGPYAKTEQFRQEVLSAALGLVAERGFDGTTLQLIADEVGRSKAGLLHHFGSLDDLMLAIVAERDVISRRDVPVKPGFAASVELMAHNAGSPGLVALFAVISALAAADTTDTPRRRHFIERYARTRKGMRRQVETAQEAGHIRDDVPADHLAALIVATMDGLQVQWLLDPDINMAEHLATMIRLLEGAEKVARR